MGDVLAPQVVGGSYVRLLGTEVQHLGRPPSSVVAVCQPHAAPPRSFMLSASHTQECLFPSSVSNLQVAAAVHHSELVHDLLYSAQIPTIR